MCSHHYAGLALLLKVISSFHFNVTLTPCVIKELNQVEITLSRLKKLFIYFSKLWVWQLITSTTYLHIFYNNVLCSFSMFGLVYKISMSSYRPILTFADSSACFLSFVHDDDLSRHWLITSCYYSSTSSVTHIFSCPLSVMLLPPLYLSTASLQVIWKWNHQTPCDHSAPRSWQERDFCLRNLPTSRSRGYRGMRLDKKRLAREVMLSRWPPPLMSSALVPGGHGDWPLASRTAHSKSSVVRWSREAEISRYRQLKRAALATASDGTDKEENVKSRSCQSSKFIFRTKVCGVISKEGVKPFTYLFPETLGLNLTNNQVTKVLQP